MRLSLLHRLVALAVLYSFTGAQLELSQEEYEKNHPTPSGKLEYAPRVLNWESFGKSDGPSVFRFVPTVIIEPLCAIPSEESPRVLPTALRRPHDERGPPA